MVLSVFLKYFSNRRVEPSHEHSYDFFRVLYASTTANSIIHSLQILQLLFSISLANTAHVGDGAADVS